MVGLMRMYWKNVGNAVRSIVFDGGADADVLRNLGDEVIGISLKAM